MTIEKTTEKYQNNNDDDCYSTAVVHLNSIFEKYNGYVITI